MMGFTGAEDLFHHDPDCAYLRGEPREIPREYAMKWDINWCLDCTGDPETVGDPDVAVRDTSKR